MNGEAGKGPDRRKGENNKAFRDGHDRIDWSDGMDSEVALDEVLNMAKGFQSWKELYEATKHKPLHEMSEENTRMTYDEFSEAIRVDFGGDGA